MHRLAPAISGEVRATAVEDIARVDERIAWAEFGRNGLVLDPILEVFPGVAAGHDSRCAEFLGDLLEADHGADRDVDHVGPGRVHVLPPVVGISVQDLGRLTGPDVHDLPGVDPVRPAMGEQDGVGDGGVDLVVEHVEVGVVEEWQRREAHRVGTDECCTGRPHSLRGGTRRELRHAPVGGSCHRVDRGPVEHAFDDEAAVSAEGLQHVVERSVGG